MQTGRKSLRQTKIKRQADRETGYFLGGFD